MCVCVCVCVCVFAYVYNVIHSTFMKTSYYSADSWVFCMGVLYSRRVLSYFQHIHLFSTCTLTTGITATVEEEPLEKDHKVLILYVCAFH